MATKQKIEQATEIAKRQRDYFNANGTYPKGFVSFEFKGIDIIDPFHDEQGMGEVDPVAYYGDAFLKSAFTA